MASNLGHVSWLRELFSKHHFLEVSLTQNRQIMALRTLTTVDLFYFYHVWGLAWINIYWNSIWLRARSHMASHYTWGSVTTLHDLEGVLGQPLDNLCWALTISWSRLLALVWSGPLRPLLFIYFRVYFLPWCIILAPVVPRHVTFPPPSMLPSHPTIFLSKPPLLQALSTPTLFDITLGLAWTRFRGISAPFNNLNEDIKFPPWTFQGRNIRAGVAACLENQDFLDPPENCCPFARLQRNHCHCILEAHLSQIPYWVHLPFKVPNPIYICSLPLNTTSWQPWSILGQRAHIHAGTHVRALSFILFHFHWVDKQLIGISFSKWNRQ